MIRHVAEENQKNELANWHKMIDTDPDKVAHMLVNNKMLREICE
jgi:hypothetical protein